MSLNGNRVYVHTAIFQGSSPIESIVSGLRSAVRPPSAKARAISSNAFTNEPNSCSDHHCASLALSGPYGTRNLLAALAAERADCWNTAGPLGLGMDQILETTRRQNERLDEMCVVLGRGPTEVRRSLFLVGALDAWADPGPKKRAVALTIHRTWGKCIRSSPSALDLEAAVFLFWE